MEDVKDTSTKFKPNVELWPNLLQSKYYRIKNGDHVCIYPNDWVMINETAFPRDPKFGNLFQVWSVQDGHLTIKIMDPWTKEYLLCTAWPVVIEGVWRVVRPV